VEEEKKSNDDNYEYDLVGVVAHNGGAEFGHYYSFIKT
jgi:ubiquitin C-terminal hydrolase